MIFQLTPYCEHKEEVESLPKHQKFLVGTVILILNTFKSFITSKALMKIKKINVSVSVFQNLNPSGALSGTFAGASEEIEFKVTQLIAEEGDETCLFQLTLTLNQSYSLYIHLYISFFKSNNMSDHY